MDIPDSQDIRIAELEAEVERLRNQQGLTFTDPPESYLVGNRQFQEMQAEIERLREMIDAAWITCCADNCSTSLPMGFADLVSTKALKQAIDASREGDNG